ncbi:hypothetical protein GH714_025422 [Hevea brasiliensis]|uniref:Uncharacterized protein n=1 Tax=Hevea brasiliensis TaxID=3981 RepID=A0A6A6NJ55_HEVBR|nr:hypothetical protein GH714_025422 [Hevea brasiliensis]
MLVLIIDANELQQLAVGEVPLLLLPVMKFMHGVKLLIIELVHDFGKTAATAPTTSAATPTTLAAPPTTPAIPPATSPADSSNKTPEPALTPSASEVPSSSGTESKTVPSTDGTSDGSIIKASLHFMLFAFFIVWCGSTVTKF